MQRLTPPWVSALPPPTPARLQRDVARRFLLPKRHSSRVSCLSMVIVRLLEMIRLTHSFRGVPCHEPRSESQTIYFSVDGDLGSFQLGANKSKIQPGKFSSMCVLIPWLRTSKARPKLRHRVEDGDAVAQKECFQPSLLS